MIYSIISQVIELHLEACLLVERVSQYMIFPKHSSLGWTNVTHFMYPTNGRGIKRTVIDYSWKINCNWLSLQGSIMHRIFFTTRCPTWWLKYTGKRYILLLLLNILVSCANLSPSTLPALTPVFCISYLNNIMEAIMPIHSSATAPANLVKLYASSAAKFAGVQLGNIDNCV